MDLRHFYNPNPYQHPSQLTDWLKIGGCSVSGFLLVVSANITLPWETASDKALRILATLAGIGLESYTLVKLNEIRDFKGAIAIQQRISFDLLAHQQAERFELLTNPPLPAVQQEVKAIAPAFDWTSLQNTVEFPHLAIEGKTGQGKSTLAQWASGILGGRIIAIAPHWKPRDFPAADLIIGAGRKYGELVDYFPSFDEIASGTECTVCEFIQALHAEMTARYNGKKGDELNVIFDEFNAYAKRKGLGELIKELIREARKVGIRLILLCHGSEVKALGIEGEGSLRMSLTRIRLGNFATDYAKIEQNRYKKESEDWFFWYDIRELLKADKRPCLVDDCYAKIPDLSNYQSSNSNSQTILGRQVIALSTPDTRHPSDTRPDTSDTEYLKRCYSLEFDLSDTLADTDTSEALSPPLEDNSRQCPNPECLSKNTKKIGKTSGGKQRRLCKDCNHSWSI